MNLITTTWTKLQKRMKQWMAGPPVVAPRGVAIPKPLPNQSYERELFEDGPGAPRCMRIGLDPTTQFAAADPEPKK